MRGIALSLIVVWVASQSDGARADVAGDPPQRIAPRVTNASTKPGHAAGTSPAYRSSSSNWMTTGGALALVLFLVLLSAKFFRNRGLSSPGILPADAVEVLGRTVVDYRHTIHLVRCGSRLLVLGSSQDGLSTLSEITDPAEVGRVAALCRAAEPAVASLGIGGLVSRFRADAHVDDTAEDEDDRAILRLRERLPPASAVHDSSTEPISPRETAG